MNDKAYELNFKRSVRFSFDNYSRVGKGFSGIKFCVCTYVCAGVLCCIVYLTYLNLLDYLPYPGTYLSTNSWATYLPRYRCTYVRPCLSCTSLSLVCIP